MMKKHLTCIQAMSRAKSLDGQNKMQQEDSKRPKSYKTFTSSLFSV